MKIIKESEVSKYLKKGYVPLDLHVHTIFSHDVIPTNRVFPENLFLEMKNKGFKYVTFTDHDRIDCIDVLQGKKGFIPGTELKIKPKKIGSCTNPPTIEINVFNITKKHYKNLMNAAKKGDFYRCIRYLKKHKMAYYYNHPAWFAPREKVDWSCLPDIAKEFDVIEVCNYGRIESQNKIALRLAKASGKGMVASSDTHIGNFAKATLVKGRNFDEIWSKIKKGDAIIVWNSMTPRKILKEIRMRLKQASMISKTDIHYKTKFRFGSNIGWLDRLVDSLVTGMKHGSIYSKSILKILKFVTEVIGWYLIRKVYYKEQMRVTKEIENKVIQAQNQ